MLNDSTRAPVSCIWMFLFFLFFCIGKVKTREIKWNVATLKFDSEHAKHEMTSWIHGNWISLFIARKPCSVHFAVNLPFAINLWPSDKEKKEKQRDENSLVSHFLMFLWQWQTYVHLFRSIIYYTVDSNAQFMVWRG